MSESCSKIGCLYNDLYVQCNHHNKPKIEMLGGSRVACDSDVIPKGCPIWWVLSVDLSGHI